MAPTLDMATHEQTALQCAQEDSGDTTRAQRPVDTAFPASIKTEMIPSSTATSKETVVKKPLAFNPLEEPRIGSLPTITWNPALAMVPRLIYPQQIREAFSRTRNPLSFHKFPPEIRENIFARCIDIDDAPDSKTSPVLIVALRGDKVLYAEVLRCFYRLSTFVVCRETLGIWERMRVNSVGKKGLQVLKMIRKVHVMAIAPQLQVKYKVLPKIFKKVGYNSIESLSFTIYSADELFKRVPTVLNGFPNLKNAGIWIPSVLFYKEHEIVVLKIHEGMKKIGAALGVKARMSWVNTGRYEYWCWTAAKGHVLSLPSAVRKELEDTKALDKRGKPESSGSPLFGSYPRN